MPWPSKDPADYSPAPPRVERPASRPRYRAPVWLVLANVLAILLVPTAGGVSDSRALVIAAITVLVVVMVLRIVVEWRGQRALDAR